MKQKKTPQPRNIYVKLALFRRAGSHRKSNKAIRRLEKSRKVFPIMYIFKEVFIIGNILSIAQRIVQ